MKIWPFKKKKEEELPLPSPPEPVQVEVPSEIPPIVPSEAPEEKEEVAAEPEAPEPEVEVKEAPPAVPLVEEKPEEFELVRPAFVASEEYSRLLDEANMIRAKLLECESVMKSISELRAAEEKDLEAWRKAIGEAERKLSRVDEILEKAKT